MTISMQHDHGAVASARHGRNITKTDGNREWELLAARLVGADVVPPRPERGQAAQVAFGRALRAAREQRGWRPSRLAHRLGVSRGYVDRIERGEHDVRLSELPALASALDMPLAELLDMVVGREGW